MSLTAMDLSELQDVAFKIDSCPEHELFIADNGASVHLTGSLNGMINLKDLNFFCDFCDDQKVYRSLRRVTFHRKQET